MAAAVGRRHIAAPSARLEIVLAHQSPDLPVIDDQAARTPFRNSSTRSTTFHQNTHLAMWLMRRDFAGRHHVPRGVLRTWRIARRA